MFDDDVWRYLPLGPVPSLALATVGTAAAVYVAVVRSRATRAIAVAMLVASVMIVLAYTARGVLSNDDGGFSWRLGESIRAELRNIGLWVCSTSSGTSRCSCPLAGWSRCFPLGDRSWSEPSVHCCYRHLLRSGRWSRARSGTSTTSS